MLTVREGAERLGMSESGMWKVIYRGDLPVVKIGRSVRVRESDIDSFIEENRQFHQPAGTAR